MSTSRPDAGIWDVTDADSGRAAETPMTPTIVPGSLGTTEMDRWTAEAINVIITKMSSGVIDTPSNGEEATSGRWCTYLVEYVANGVGLLF